MNINERMAQFQALPQNIKDEALREAMAAFKPTSKSKIAKQHNMHANAVILIIFFGVGWSVVNAVSYIVGLFA